MRLACVQLDPRWGEPDQNMKQATELLDSFRRGDIDFLVLPEMAFVGYVFRKNEIQPFLEDAESGPSVRWAKATAARLNCFVQLGYAETARDACGAVRNYNSACVVGPDGGVLHTYRKHFLFEADETWADEGPSFHALKVVLDADGARRRRPRSLTVGVGICMDINPYRFQSPFGDFEFARYQLEAEADLILFSTNWLSYYPEGGCFDENGNLTSAAGAETAAAAAAADAVKEERRAGGGDIGFSSEKRRATAAPGGSEEEQADERSACLETVNYWLLRLLPLHQDDDGENGDRVAGAARADDGPARRSAAETKKRSKRKRVILVAADRVGKERGCVFAGASCVVDMRPKARPRLLQMLGGKEAGVLFVDVDEEGLGDG